jgi:hypothetical protein
MRITRVEIECHHVTNTQLSSKKQCRLRVSFPGREEAGQAVHKCLNRHIAQLVSSFALHANDNYKYFQLQFHQI